MQRIVALDFGLKRTGIAISDENRMFAFGWGNISSEKLMETLIEIKNKEPFDTIALGYPTRLDNSDSHITENVRMLKQALEKQFVDIKVELVDERYTSKMASETIHKAGGSKRMKKQKGLIDQVSATIILQAYLSQLEM